MEFELFPGKNLGGLFKDIFKNQQTKKRRISELIFDLKKAIRKDTTGAAMNTNDVMMIYPIIKDLVDSAVKNDDALIKMAVIAQRIVASSTKVEGDSGFLTEKEKEQLLQDVQVLGEKVGENNNNGLEVLESDIERIKHEMIEDGPED